MQKTNLPVKKSLQLFVNNDVDDKIVEKVKMIMKRAKKMRIDYEFFDVEAIANIHNIDIKTFLYVTLKYNFSVIRTGREDYIYYVGTKTIVKEEKHDSHVGVRLFSEHLKVDLIRDIESSQV